MAVVWPRLRDRSSITFYSVTTLTFMAKITSTAIVTTLATHARRGKSIFSLAVAASIFELFALTALLAATGLFLRRVPRGWILAVGIPGAIVCLSGSILAIATLSNALHVGSSHLPHEIARHHTRDLVRAGIAAAAIGVIPQAVFWNIIWPRPVTHSVLSFDDQLLPRKQVKQRSLSVHLASLGTKSIFDAQYEPNPPLSPSCSLYSPSGSSSLRNSTSESLRPMTSRTRLVLRTSFGSRSSKITQPSPGATSHSLRSPDEFENWDTSRVKYSFETHPSKTAMPRLEPIPGSRPVSPANPLNGPFAGEHRTGPAPLPECAEESPATAVGDRDKSSVPNRSRLHGRQGGRPSIVIPTAAASGQHYIHPLFRTQSTAPPPLTSPGTVITASPYAGQIFSPEFALQSPRLLGSRESSRPASPSLLSPVMSRPGSIKSFRTVPVPAIESSPERIPE